MATKETLYIISGEGTEGTRQRYYGKQTRLAMLRRQRKEECGGDRWAIYKDADGQQVYPEQYPDA